MTRQLNIPPFGGTLGGSIMIIDARIKSIGSLQSGEKRDGSGKWFSKDIVLEICDGTRFPDEYVVRLTGENAQNPEIEEGKLCQADVSFSSREYKGRYYQDAWVRSLEVVKVTTQSEEKRVETESQEPKVGEDLPF